MALTYTVKVGSGPGTSGYEHMTEKQRKAVQAWATFAMYRDACFYAQSLAVKQPTWTIEVTRRELGKDHAEPTWREYATDKVA